MTEFDSIIESLQEKSWSEQLEYKQNFFDIITTKFEWDLTWLFTRLLKNYKEQKILVDWTKLALDDMKSLYNSRVKKLETMENTIDYFMQKSEQKNIETNNWKISYRKSDTLDILDENKITEDFIEIVETKKIDKMAIKKAIKKWQEFDFAVLTEHRNLQIK